MIQYVHFIASTLDTGGQVDTIYLDIAKAFERVPIRSYSINYDTLAFETHF